MLQNDSESIAFFLIVAFIKKIILSLHSLENKQKSIVNLYRPYKHENVIVLSVSGSACPDTMAAQLQSLCAIQDIETKKQPGKYYDLLSAFISF